MVWIIECRATESLQKTCGNDISLPSKQRKNISQGSIGPYNTPKQLWAGKHQAKISPFNYVRPMCYSQTSEAKNARFRDRREQVIYTSTPKRSGTWFTMVWIVECRATESLHKTCGNDISLPSKQRKNISRGSIGPYNTPHQLWTGKKIQQKITFQLFSTHVLFPNITSKKCQMQRPERTSHFHANSKDEWNMFYDGVNHRVQSNRQFTQDLRQWHKSSIEAEKNISQGSIGPYNTPKQLWAGKNQAKISPFNYVRPMCYSQTSEAKNARFRDRREQVIYTSTPKRSGTWFTMVWIVECRATESLHKTCGNDISLPSKQRKNISRGSIGPYNTPKQL